MTIQKANSSSHVTIAAPPLSYDWGQRSITPEKIEGNRLPGRCWQHHGQHITRFDRLQGKKRGVYCPAGRRSGRYGEWCQAPIPRGGHPGRKQVGNRKIRKKRIAKRRKACYNAPCVRPKGAAPTLGCRQAVRHQTLTLAFVGSNPAIPAKSDPLAQLAEQLPFKQWVRGSNPRRVTRSRCESTGIFV